MDNLVEQLAALEHEQWCYYSQNVAKTEKNLSPERLARWKSLWVPYEQLPEEMKEHDRAWARKAIAIMLESQARVSG